MHLKVFLLLISVNASKAYSDRKSQAHKDSFSTFSLCTNFFSEPSKTIFSIFIIRENALVVEKRCGIKLARIRRCALEEILCKFQGIKFKRPEQIDRNKSSHDNLNAYIEELRKCHIEKRDKLRKSAPKKQRAGNYSSFAQGTGEIDYSQRRQNTEIGQHIPHAPVEPHRSTTPNHQILQFIDKNTPYNAGRAFILYIFT